MIITPNDVHEYPKIIRAIKYNFSMLVRINIEQSQGKR